jgi:hypothetical protein
MRLADYFLKGPVIRVEVTIVRYESHQELPFIIYKSADSAFGFQHSTDLAASQIAATRTMP